MGSIVLGSEHSVLILPPHLPSLIHTLTTRLSAQRDARHKPTDDNATIEDNTSAAGKPYA